MSDFLDGRVFDCSYFIQPKQPRFVGMFAKPKDGRRVGQTRSNQKARPASLPSFMRSDPDGELAALYKRFKMASTKPKLPAGRERRALGKSRPVTSEYDHVKSPVGNYIRRPFVSASKKQLIGTDVWNMDNYYEITQNASLSDYGKKFVGGDDFEGVGIEELGYKQDFEGNFQNLGINSRCSKEELFSIWTAGIGKVQQCTTTLAVFESFAETFHEVLERMSCAVSTANSSSQTKTPKLRRCQMNFVYAGPWERSSLRENSSTQTEEQNLTFEKQPTMELQKNSSQPNWGRKLFGWKHFGMMFFVLAVFLCLMEIPNLF